MRLDHLLSKEHADLRSSSLGCGGAPRSRTHVSCGDAHGWNINGVDARASVGLALLVQLHLSLLVGGGGGGNVGLGLLGWVSGTLLGPEGPHLLLVGFFLVVCAWSANYWSCRCVCDAAGGCGRLGVVLLVC